jgi:hypothetical protein
MTLLMRCEVDRLLCCSRGRSLRRARVGYRLLIYIMALGVLFLARMALMKQTVLAVACLLIFVIFSLGLTGMLLGVGFRFRCCVLGLFWWRGRIDRRFRKKSHTSQGENFNEPGGT